MTGNVFAMDVVLPRVLFEELEGVGGGACQVGPGQSLAFNYFRSYPFLLRDRKTFQMISLEPLWFPMGISFCCGL